MSENNDFFVSIELFHSLNEMELIIKIVLYRSTIMSIIYFVRATEISRASISEW